MTASAPRNGFPKALKTLYDWLDEQLGGDISVLSAAEIAFLNGVTAGTAAAGKALVLDGSSKIDSLDMTVMKVGGVTKTNVIVGAASGYMIARSAAPLALDGSNPTSAAHGLTTCVAAFATLAGSVAPGVSTCLVTPVINGANIDFYGWKPTSNANPTLVASTGTETFNWFAIGV